MKSFTSKFHIYNVPASFLNFRLAIFLLITTVVVGIWGFMVVEGYSLLDSAYMTVITISTVGYTEVKPLSDLGKAFATFYIAFNVGILSYVLAVFSYYVIQGEIFKNMHLNLIKNTIEGISDHVIICGYGRYGREAAIHFKNHATSFVIIEANESKVQFIREIAEKYLYIEGDATHDGILIEAGIHRARAIISALPEDSDNVFTVLSARQLNNKVMIISRAKDPQTEKKLRLAGADHVVLPDQIGGFFMATLVTNPGAIDFLSLITNEYRSDIGFETIRYEDLPEQYRGKSIRELKLRQKTGANIIGLQNPMGNYIVNPEPDIVLKPQSSLIVLGSREQLESLKVFFH